MLTGPQALGALHEALAEVRAEERTIAERLSRASEKAARLRETEAGHFRALAEERLGGEQRQSVTKRLGGAEKRAREMIARHSGELEAAQKRLTELDAELGELGDRRQAETEALDEAQAELAALSETVVEELEADKSFAKQRQQAERLFEIAERAMQKTEQAEADREEKGQPYRSDALFMYLWERGYGTKAYRANTLVRALDGWVARMVDFYRARPNFAMLNEIPLRLREHAERLQASADAAGDELEHKEIEAIDKAGGKKAREAIAAAQAEIEAIDNDMVAAEDERDEQARAQRQLAEGSDPAFRDAVQLLADSLAHEEVGTLLAAARATQTGRDDTIVAQIEQTRQQITEDETEVREDRERLKTLATRRRELEDIQWEFKKQRFDDPRSTFDKDELAGNTLEEFLRGAITAATYWGLWRASQGWNQSTRRAGGRIGLPREPFRGVVWRHKDRGKRVSGFPWGAVAGAVGAALARPRGGGGSRGTRRHGGFKTRGGF